MVRFVEPWFLLLLAPVAAGLVLSYRHVHGMMRGRKRFSFALRAVLAGCLVVALAGPESHRPNEGLCTLFILDRSDSVSDADLKRAETFVGEALKSLGDKDVAGVVVFGRDAAVDASPSRFGDLGKVASVVDRSASDLAAAVRLASASFPDGKARRIVLLTDGNETTGDATDAVNAAAADGIAIDAVPLGQEGRPGEVLLVDAEMPTDVRTGQPFDVRVVVDADQAADAILTLDRDGRVVKRQAVRVEEGRSTLVVSDVVDESGFHRYRATLEARGDRDTRNNVGMGFVAVRGKPKILVLQARPGPSVLARALGKQGIDTDVFGPEGAPTRPEHLQPYDAVVFDDLNASTITEAQMKLVRAAVRDTGVGMAMIGGENSFLPGGWYGTPVAEALPVDLNIRQRKTFPSTSILIVCDTSGSMSMIEDGHPKVRLAAKAAEHTVGLMAPRDRVGVAGSTDGIEFVAPMQTLSNKSAVISQIRKLDTGGGGIYIKPSMDFADKHLSAESSTVRHLILLADGADSDMQEGALAKALAMQVRKITTSVVSIGDGKDVPFLKRLAAVGGGQFYLALKAGQLPAIFTQDAALMSRSAIEEGAFLPKSVAGEEILRGIAPSSFPPLLAYCLSDSKPLARVGMRTDKDDPLLATWQFGLGTTLAFTSDAQPRWAARWVPWDGFGTFWAQAARAISRRASNNLYDLRTEQSGGRGKIVLEARDPSGALLDNLQPDVRVSTPSGQSLAVQLAQQGPGLYKGEFDTAEVGSYIVTIAEADAAGGPRVNASGFSLAYPPEYRAYRANRPLLERLAKAGSGEILTDPTRAVRPVAEPGFSIQELWPTLVLLAALLLPLDVASRRIALPIGEMFATAWAWLRSVRRRERAPVPQVETVGRLKAAKQRSRHERAEPAPVEVPAPIEAPPPAPPVAPAAPGESAASRLLDAKKKRKE